MTALRASSNLPNGRIIRFKPMTTFRTPDVNGHVHVPKELNGYQLSHTLASGQENSESRTFSPFAIHSVFHIPH